MMPDPPLKAPSLWAQIETEGATLGTAGDGELVCRVVFRGGRPVHAKVEGRVPTFVSKESGKR